MALEVRRSLPERERRERDRADRGGGKGGAGKRGGKGLQNSRVPPTKIVAGRALQDAIGVP